MGASINWPGSALVHSVPCAQVVGVFVAFAGDAVIANMHSGR